MRNIRADWKTGLNSGTWQRSGVYFIQDSTGEVLYIGKATATYEKRIQGRQLSLKEAAHTLSFRLTTAIYSFPHALESFLIAQGSCQI